MHCHECGQDIRTDKAFCSSCGAKIRQTSHNEAIVQTSSPVDTTKPRTDMEATLSTKRNWDNLIAYGFAIVLLITLAMFFKYGLPLLLNNTQDPFIETNVVEKHLNGKTDKFYKQNGYTWVDTSNYKGWEKNNKYNGYGVYSEGGDLYKGEFKDGMRHGYGIQTWADGDRYEGEFRNDKSHGLGVYTWAFGDRYDGRVKNNKMHGLGVYTFKNGEQHEGQWRNNKFKSGAKRVISK
jgi:hypothetical protein